MESKPDTGANPGRPSRTSWFLALGTCVAFGVVMAVLPHLLTWRDSGDSTWFGSNDELNCYLPFAAVAYHNHPWRLSDPALTDGGYTMYPWLQLIPGVITTKILGWRPQDIPLAWRLWSGLSLSLGLFLLLCQHLKHPWRAALATMMLTADSGFAWARPVFRQAVMFMDLVRNSIPVSTFDGTPSLLLHWRLTSPGITIGFVFLHLFLMQRARETPTRPRLIAAGLGFGALFYAYFYFWTAAAVGLVLAIILDAGYRRTYAQVAAIGLLAGLPALAANMQMAMATNPDWPHRTNLFIPVPRTFELFVPPGAVIWALGGLAWVLCRRRELMPVWAFATGSFLLMNQTVVTGLYMCNGHWAYGRGIGFSLLLTLLVLGEASGIRRWSKAWVSAGLAACGVFLSTGVVLRALEARRSQQPMSILSAYQKYGEQRRATQTVKLVPNAVIAGDHTFIDLAVVMDGVRPLAGPFFLSPSVDNAEWDARETLEGVAMGQNRDQFAEAQQEYFTRTLLGPWSFHPELRPARIASRMVIYDSCQSNPESAWNRFGVKYVVLPASQAEPPYLKRGWRALSTGPHWQLWERQ